MKRKIEFVDTTLRDAHQSTIATRMTTDEMLPILETIDQVGYRALEVWGGATFDACLRFLNEDPWERLRTIKQHVKKTKLQMLLRGQNILGYKHYPDDVLELFIKKAVENGIDIIRIFDALNDVRNLEKAIQFTKKYGAHAQAALSYTISPVHTPQYYAELVRSLIELGIDSLCIKDMAGLLTPVTARDLVRSIKKENDIEIEMHTHCTVGTGSMAYLGALEAGADIFDTATAPSRVLPASHRLRPCIRPLKSMKTSMSISMIRCSFLLRITLSRSGRIMHQSMRTSNISTLGYSVHRFPGECCQTSSIS